MDVRIDHPTDRPNFTRVNVGHLVVWFSYSTAIAYHDGFGPTIVRENEWGPTTGKHLNYVDNGAKDARVDGETFNDGITAILDRLAIVQPAN